MVLNLYQITPSNPFPLLYCVCTKMKDVLIIMKMKIAITFCSADCAFTYMQDTVTGFEIIDRQGHLIIFRNTAFLFKQHTYVLLHWSYDMLLCLLFKTNIFQQR